MSSEINIKVGVGFTLHATMWDCLKMRILGFSKNDVLEYIEKVRKEMKDDEILAANKVLIDKSEYYRIGIIEAIEKGIFTTKFLVEALSKREGVTEVWIDPHIDYSVNQDIETLANGSGPARILVIID